MIAPTAGGGTVRHPTAPRASAAQKRTAWLLVGLAAAANAAGYLMDLWERFGWYDDVVHFYATFALTLVLALYLYGPVLTGARRSTLPLVLVIASVGLAIGALWELAEWMYDWYVPGDVILGKPDTMGDLALDAAGAFLAAALAVIFVRGAETGSAEGPRRREVRSEDAR